MHYSTPLIHHRFHRVHAKRLWSREGDEAQARKRKGTASEATGRASLADEVARQMRANEFALGRVAPGLRMLRVSTTKGENIVVNTIDSVPTTEGAGSGEPDLSIC